VQAGDVEPAELAMYAALMTSNTNVQMVVSAVRIACHTGVQLSGGWLEHL
jgi:hypothetical protein